jgi:hypothetical protein
MDTYRLVFEAVLRNEQVKGFVPIRCVFSQLRHPILTKLRQVILTQLRQV